jgi:hypothetical protein
MAEQSDRIKKEAKETAQVVEDAFRSISSKIGDYFEEALSKGEGVSKNMVRDVQSSLNSLSRVSKDIAANFEKANKGLLTQKNVTKEIQERNAKLATIQAQIGIAQRSGVGNIKQLNKEYEQVLKYNQEYEQELQKQLKFSKNLNTSIGLTGSAISGISKLASKIGLSGMADVFEEAREAAIEKAKALGVSETRSLGLIGKIRTMGAAFKVIGKGILKNLVDPLVLAAGALSLIKKAISFVTAGYDEGKIAAERISTENTNIARSLGLAQGVASKLAGSVAGIGPTVEASKEAVNGLYSALGSTEKLSNNTLKVFVKLSTFAGMSAESLASFQKFAKLSGQDAGVLVTNMAQTALETIKTNKFAFSQKSLLNDVANVSSVIRLRFRDQPKALVESVAKAKALGIEMNKIEDIASSLLNFEDSIAAEMEAELLTGKQLNLEKAREAALAGDTATLQNEIASQLGSIEEFNRMNVIQQEAFAKSIGLSRGELAGMLDAQQSNLSTQGDLVDGQQNGLKAMMSGVSEAEKNSEIDRRRQEASIKYYTTLSNLVQTLKDTFNKIKETLTGLFTDLVVKPMVDWVSSPAGKEFIDSLPEKAEKFANGIRNAAKVAKTAFEGITTFIKENPVLSKTIGLVAGGSLLIKGGMSLFKGKSDGSKNNPFFVKLAEGASSIADMFTSKTKSPKGPLTKSGKPDMRYKTNRTPTTSTPSGGGGGGFFSKIGSKIADSNLGKFVSKTASKATNLASKAIKFANPMTYIKEYMPKLMNSKGFKKTISSIPKIGKIASLAMIAYDLISQGAGISAATKQGVGPQDIGKQIVMALGDVGGSIIGGLLGTLIPVPGVGTMLGTFLGGLGGSALAGLIADNTDVSGIGNWAINALGGSKDGGSAEDFILQDGKMTKFRKDDVIVGGTNLGGGDNGKTIQLLERLIAAVEKGGVVMLDGQKVGTALNVASYRMQ